MIEPPPRDRVALFPFRYYDEIRGRWVRARYVATLEEIRARHERYEITGPAELRDVGDMFDNTYRGD